MIGASCAANGECWVKPSERYELLEKIASGSFATVYRGRDLELGREVAVKQIHEQYLEDSQQLDRYWQEAQLLASLQHPNIVTIYDVVRDKGWLILELMQSDLSKVAGRRQMPLESLRTTLAHCLRALKFLHAHGIVHGDVKPSNMMVDRRRRVKLGDFGLARRVSDEEGSLIKGTTKYMAPEVVSDEFGEVGPASDLYSLGFAAFELMCGENFESLFPGLNSFGRDRQTAWMMWHAAPDRRLPDIQRLLADVPPDLAKTIQKLTAKPLAQRYKNADEALADLNIDVRAPRPGEESALGLTQPVAKDPARTRRLIAIGAFAASLLVSLLAIWAPWEGNGTLTPPPDEHDRPTAGVVREVLPDQGKIVVEDDHTFVHEYSVIPKLRIRLDDDRYILLRELKPEDRIELWLTEDQRVNRIAALRPALGRGELKEIDPDRHKLLATLAADPHPQDVPMYVSEHAKLLLNGQSAKLAELREGDRIEVSHVRDTGGRAARDVVRLEARRPVQFTSFVREVTARDGKQWLTCERHGVILESKEFAADCRITINDESGEGGRAYVPADLKKGDRVVVTHDDRITAVAAERRDRQSGVVMKVDPDTHQIFVRADEDGREVKFSVADDCRILVEDQKGAFGDLQKFDKVEVTWEQFGDAPPSAQTIDVKRPKS